MNKSKTIEIPSELGQIKKVSSEVLDFLKPYQLSHSKLLDIRLCLDESLINAIKYGNKLNKNLKAKIDYSISDSKLKISVTDEGQGFDYNNLPDPTVEEKLLELKGRGIYLIKHLMDKVEFNQRGNSITMVKFLNSGGKR